MRRDTIDHRSAPSTVPAHLAKRVWGGFQEMPGLRVSLKQAARLFGVDPPTCSRILEDLVLSGHLSLNRGHFLRASGESPLPTVSAQHPGRT
jgi:hypothetical protein